MKCCCQESRDGITYCDAHARETKRRLKIIAGDLAMAGEDLRKELGFRAAAGDPTVNDVERKWLLALRKAKEAVDG